MPVRYRVLEDILKRQYSKYRRYACNMRRRRIHARQVQGLSRHSQTLVA